MGSRPILTREDKNQATEVHTFLKPIIPSRLERLGRTQHIHSSNFVQGKDRHQRQLTAYEGRELMILSEGKGEIQHTPREIDERTISTLLQRLR